MYVEKDNTGRIIIQEIMPEEAELLDYCICHYFSDKPLQNRTSAERSVIKLKHDLEKIY